METVGESRVLVARRGPHEGAASALQAFGVDVLAPDGPAGAFRELVAQGEQLRGLVLDSPDAAPDTLGLALHARRRRPDLPLVAIGGSKLVRAAVEDLGGVALPRSACGRAVVEALLSPGAARPADYDRFRKRLNAPRPASRRPARKRIRAALAAAAVALPGSYGASAQPEAASRLDLDRDGVITLPEARQAAWDEFGALAHEALNTRSMEGRSRGLAGAAWNLRVSAADQDQDGRVTREEYVDHVVESFRRADQDRDDALDTEEAGRLEVLEF